LIYGIIGDIHSNYDAFTAVVGELRQEQVDRILCVGDIVGYAAEPARCIELVQELNCIVVAGNHDYATVGKFPVEYFHTDARTAVLWTANQLSDGYMHFLKNLPLVQVIDDVTIVHASLSHPEFFDYIVTLIDAQLNLDLLKTTICFYGHTHVPLALYMEKGAIHVDRGNVFDLNKVDKILINVGSVGQPRDWDMRASCAIYDTDKKIVRIKRVKYNINDAVKKVYMAGLPSINAIRLMDSVT